MRSGAVRPSCRGSRQDPARQRCRRRRQGRPGRGRSLERRAVTVQICDVSRPVSISSPSPRSSAASCSTASPREMSVLRKPSRPKRRTTPAPTRVRTDQQKVATVNETRGHQRLLALRRRPDSATATCSRFESAGEHASRATRPRICGPWRTSHSSAARHRGARQLDSVYLERRTASMAWPTQSRRTAVAVARPSRYAEACETAASRRPSAASSCSAAAARGRDR